MPPLQSRNQWDNCACPW